MAGGARDMIVQNSLLMNASMTDDCKAMTLLTSKVLRSCLCVILMRHKLIYQEFDSLCRDNSVTSEISGNTEQVVTV